MKTISRKGFTLIELLIVIAIIAVLAVAFLPQVLGAPSKGRDAQRLAQIQKLQQFLTAESVSGNTLPASGCLATATSAPAVLINANIGDFGGVFPTDPQGDGATAATVATGTTCKGYGYVKFTDPKKTGFSAALYVVVENVENANAICGSIVEGASSTITLTPGKYVAEGVTAPTGKTALTTGQTPCQVALIQ